jgi:autotransporter-associated beta strand protein
MTWRTFTLGLCALSVGLSFAGTSAAQTSFTWAGTTGALWDTPGNWSPAPGTTGPGSSTDPTNTDIATFGVTGTSATIQLNFGTLGSPRYLGTITQTGGVARTIGSSTSTAGTLVLNGTGANNLIIDNPSGLALTFAPQAGSGTGPMSLQLVAANSTVSTALGTSATNTGLLSISANIGEGATPAGITKAGTGILLLSGTNTFTGPTNVAAGFVQYANSVSLYNDTSASWTTSNLTVQPGAAAVFRVGGSGFTTAEFDTLRTLGSATGGFLNGSAIGIDTTNASLTYSGNIADTNGGANSIGFHKFGTNTLTLTGTNTYTGGTFVRTGTLAVSGNQSGLPAGGNVTVGDPSAVTTGATFNIGTATQTAPSTYSLGSVTVGGPASGTGNLIALSGNSGGNGTTVTVAGPFVLQRGTVNTLANATLNLNGPLSLVSSLGSSATAFNATFNVGAAGAVVNYLSSTPISFSAQQSGSNAGFLGSRLNNNAGLLVLGTSINQDANFTAGSTATAQVTFQNAATLRLSGNVPVLLTTSLGNASTNPLPIMGFGAAANGVSGVIDTNGFSTAINTPITNIVTNTNGAISVTGGGTLTIAGHNSFSGGVALAAGTTLNINNGGVAGQTGIAASYASGASFVVVSAGSIPNLVVGQRLTGSGTSIAAGTFIRAIDTSANTITLSQNTAAAGTSLGTSATSSLGTGTFTIQGGTIDNTSGGPVTLATNNAQSWAGDFTFTGSNNLNLGTGAVTLTGNRAANVAGGVLTVGGAIGGAFSLTKNGAGTLATTGVNTYTGGTTVNAGTLQVQSGSLAAGAVAVNGGGSLRGAGTINGPVTVNGGATPGTIRPGNTGVGTLTLANGLTTTGTGRLAFDLLNGSTPAPAAPDSGGSTAGTVPNPTSNSFLDITGSLSLSSGTTVSVIGTGVTFSPTQSYSFQVGRVTGSPAAFSVNALNQFSFTDFSVSPTFASLDGLATGEVYLNLSFTPVPEPGSVGLVLAGVIGLYRAGRWLRRRGPRATGVAEPECPHAS